MFWNFRMNLISWNLRYHRANTLSKFREQNKIEGNKKKIWLREKVTFPYCWYVYNRKNPEERGDWNLKHLSGYLMIMTLYYILSMLLRQPHWSMLYSHSPMRIQNTQKKGQRPNWGGSTFCRSHQSSSFFSLEVFYYL